MAVLSVYAVPEAEERGSEMAEQLQMRQIASSFYEYKGERKSVIVGLDDKGAVWQYRGGGDTPGWERLEMIERERKPYRGRQQDRW